VATYLEVTYLEVTIMKVKYSSFQPEKHPFATDTPEKVVLVSGEAGLRHMCCHSPKEGGSAGTDDQGNLVVL
jgi:hypothetical protein